MFERLWELLKRKGCVEQNAKDVVSLQLETIPGLADRMGALMCVVGEPEAAEEDAEVEDAEGKAGKLEVSIKEAKLKAQEKGGDVLWLELDDLDIGDSELQSLNLTAEFPVQMVQMF